MHLSFLVVITCGDIYECNYARPRSALCVRVVITAEPSVITLVVNISTCNYNWEGLNESPFPAHLYLSQYYNYISRPYSSKFHSRPFARSVYRQSQSLVSSATDKITAKCRILCPKTLLFLTEKQLQATHFFAATCNIPLWLSHNPVRMHN